MKLHWNLERSRSLKPNLPFIDEYHTVPPSSFDRLNFSREIRQLRDFDRSFAGLTHIGRVITTDAFTSCHTVRRFLSETLSLSLSLFLSLSAPTYRPRERILFVLSSHHDLYYSSLFRPALIHLPFISLRFPGFSHNLSPLSLPSSSPNHPSFLFGPRGLSLRSVRSLARSFAHLL